MISHFINDKRITWFIFSIYCYLSFRPSACTVLIVIDYNIIILLLYTMSSKSKNGRHLLSIPHQHQVLKIRTVHNRHRPHGFQLWVLSISIGCQSVICFYSLAHTLHSEFAFSNFVLSSLVPQIIYIVSNSKLISGN